MDIVSLACPNCGTTLGAGVGACPQCGGPPLARAADDSTATNLGAFPPTAESPDSHRTASMDPAHAGLRPPELPDEIGRLGGYRVLALLGTGGMGAVYRAEDPKLRRQVALKIMLPNSAASPLARARFVREARAAAAVENDHIVPIHQVGEDNGIPFLAMPVLKGESLADFLRTNGVPPLTTAVRMVREVADGLAAAHAVGLVHRDIKPGNIWLEASRRRVRILDFGLARGAGEAAEDVTLTKEGTVLGTPAYMSPEQARSEPVDARTDLWSLGVVLYQLATGKMPFKGATAMATVMSIGTDRPKPPRELNARVTDALNALILQLLEKDPDCRPASASDLGARLAEIEVGLTAVVMSNQHIEPVADAGDVFSTLDANEPVPPRAKPVRRSGGLKWLALALAAGLLSVGVALAVLFGMPSAKGTLEIDSDDPEADWVVKQAGKVVQERSRTSSMELPPGKYIVELVGKAPGTRLEPAGVEVVKNAKSSVRVRREVVAPIAKEREKFEEPQRRLAKWVLSRGKGTSISVRPVAGGNQIDAISSPDDLPSRPFVVIGLIWRNVRLASIDVNELKGLDQLRQFSLSLAVGPEATLAPIVDALPVGLSHFSWIGDGASPLTDVSITRLARFVELGSLQLISPGRASDEAIARLANLKKLATVDFRDMDISDRGLIALRGLPLKHLGLSKTAGDETVRSFSEVGSLYSFGLTRSQATPACFKYLAQFKQFTGIEPPSATYTAADLKPLLELPNLREIRFNESRLPPEAYEGLARMPELTTLMVQYCTADDLVALARCKKLKSLDLYAGKLTPASLDALSASISLEYIRVHGSTGVTADDFRRLHARLPRARILGIGVVLEPINALTFDGKTSFVKVPSFHFDGKLPMTVEAWITPEVVTGADRHICVLGFPGLGIGISPAGSFGAGLFDGKDWHETFAAPLVAGKRVHVAAVFTSDGITLFIDGAIADVKAVKLAPKLTGQGDGLIGKNPEGAPVGYFQGAMHGLRVSRTARYTKVFSPPARLESDGETVAVYQFGEGQGNKLTDGSPNARHGEIVNGKWR